MFPRPLTGKTALMLTLGAFGVIVAVNLGMAVMAVRTFPGLEVENAYIASQSFDADKRAQDRLGWTVTRDYAPGGLRLMLRDRAGAPAPVAGLMAVVGRVTSAGQDVTPVLDRAADGAFVAPLRLAPGAWQILLTATATDGTVFRQKLDLTVAP